jgi:hypothetical protein
MPQPDGDLVQMQKADAEKHTNADVVLKPGDADLSSDI